MLFDFRKWKKTKTGEYRLKISWVEVLQLTVFLISCPIMFLYTCSIWFFPAYEHLFELPTYIACGVALAVFILCEIVEVLDARKHEEHVKKFMSMRKSAPPYNLDNALKSRPFEEAVCECFEDSARENSECMNCEIVKALKDEYLPIISGFMDDTEAQECNRLLCEMTDEIASRVKII